MADPILLSGDLRPSEHGLGQYLDPSDLGSTHWIPEVWRSILDQALRLAYKPPKWFERHTVIKNHVTSIEELRVFETYNAGREYAQRIKPFNFLI